MASPKNTVSIARQSWRVQSPSLRLLRIFLGLTWIYAGWDKASDPGFLTQGSATFIGTQLSAYSTNSPVGSLIQPLVEHSLQVGIFVMASEFAIGIATLLWIAPTLAAFGGFAMSTGLWLASSFYVQPYFFASDLAYAIMWLSYFLALLGKRRKIDLSLDRRGFIRVVLVGAGAVAGIFVGKFFSSDSKALDQSAPLASPKKIIKESDLAIGETFNFSAANGAPAVLFRTKTGVFAYSAICTHEGCTVTYSKASENLQCACHGAVFDPKADGKAISGPTNTPLGKITVGIEGAWVVQS
jgi:thiosulfate dehydrogenase [quinone] large subunit